MENIFMENHFLGKSFSTQPNGALITIDKPIGQGGTAASKDKAL